MSIRVMSRIWDNSPASGRELLVELALADFADDDGRCWPAVETIAKKARCSESTVHNTIRTLVKAGRLRIEPEAGPFGTNVYVWIDIVKAPTQRGATIAPGGATITPPREKRGVQIAPGGVQPATEGGAITEPLGGVQIAPDPSSDPSIDPSLESSAPRTAQNGFIEEIQERRSTDGDAQKASHAGRITTGNYRTWIEPTTFVVENDQLTILAGNEQRADWIRGRLANVIGQCAKSAGIDTVEVKAR